MSASIVESNDEFIKFEKIKENFEWFHYHHEILKEEYESQYVAIKDRKVLDNDNDLERLVKRLDIKNYDKSIATEFVYI
jgi:hypothetical protein